MTILRVAKVVLYLRAGLCYTALSLSVCQVADWFAPV